MFKNVLGGKPLDDKNRRKVIVLSADHGLVGKAILPQLVSRKLLDVYAGVNDPSRFPEMEGVTVLKTDMEDKKAIHKVFKQKKFDRVIIVVPGNRPDWAENAIEAADHTKHVKFVVVVSLIVAEIDTFFGNNYGDIEKELKHYFPFGHCIVRLPQLMDATIPLYAKSIREEGSFRDPRDPEKPFRCIALSDVAKAIMEIILRPGNHEGKLYNLLGPSITVKQQAVALTKAIGKDVEHLIEHYEQYRETLEGARVPEWSIHGTFEIYSLIDEGNDVVNMKDTGDYEKLSGEKPMSLEKWCQANAGLFKK